MTLSPFVMFKFNKIFDSLLTSIYSSLYSVGKLISTVPVIVKIAHLGKIPFYCFAQTYRIYQYFKINRSVVLHKLHLK